MSDHPAVAEPTLEEIRAAQSRLAGLALKTPLVRLNHPDHAAEIYLKLENLQPVGAFKIRCIGNIIRSTDAAELRRGAFNASSGNSGVALAWLARELSFSATTYAPDTAPAGKCAAIRRLGARVEILPYPEWWDIICQRRRAGESGLYVDAVTNPAAIAGNATIGLEILQDLPDVDTIVVPFGGGGVSCGIASAVRALSPGIRVIASESEMATPLAAALAAGQPQAVGLRPGFISGIGAESVLPEMWPLVRHLLDRSMVCSLTAVADAVRTLFEFNRVVAEGAAATTLACALSLDTRGPIVCVITGGNIDKAHMAAILQGGVPAVD